MYHDEDFSIGMAVGALLAFVLSAIIFCQCWASDHDAQIAHYNKDFSHFCITQGGIPTIGDKNICVSATNGKLLMLES